MSETGSYDTKPAPLDEAPKALAQTWGVRLQEALLAGLAANGQEWTWEPRDFRFPCVLAGKFTRSDGRALTIECLWDEALNACEHVALRAAWRPHFAPDPHPLHWMVVTDARAEIILFQLRHTLFPRTALEFAAQETAYREFLLRGQELAREIARELGEGWESWFGGDPCHDYAVQLTSGELLIRFDWAGANQLPRDRYTIHGSVDPALRRYVHSYPSITVTSKKTPRQIASEIRRRILPVLVPLAARAEQARLQCEAQLAQVRQVRDRLLASSGNQLELEQEPESEALSQGLRYWPRRPAPPGGRQPRPVRGGERLNLKIGPPSDLAPEVCLELQVRPSTAVAVLELLAARQFFALVPEPDEAGDG